MPAGSTMTARRKGTIKRLRGGFAQIWYSDGPGNCRSTPCPYGKRCGEYSRVMVDSVPCRACASHVRHDGRARFVVCSAEA